MTKLEMLYNVISHKDFFGWVHYYFHDDILDVFSVRNINEEFIDVMFIMDEIILLEQASDKIIIIKYE